MFKVLIIDDERSARIAIRKLGRWNSFGVTSVAEALHGQDALQVMRELRPDIIFVDMKMPHMNGIEFLEEAQREFPPPKHQYVVISGYDDFLYAQAAMKNGASDYILKPIVPDELNSAIGRALLKIYPNLDFSTISEPAKITSADVVELIKQYMDTNYAKNIKVSDFADQYFFSKEYLMKLFKQRYNVSIYDYLQKIRMERAVELLSNLELSIQSIATRVGYADDNYFSKAFRTYYGISPGRWRSNAASKN